MALAAVAGYMDAYGIVRYGTYLSFMSGNTTQVGYHTGLGQFAVVPLLGTGIVGFLFGSFAGNLYPLTRRATLGAIALALAFIFGLAVTGHSITILSVALLSIAMGAMNTALPSVGRQAVNLTFVTGTLNRLGTHLALAARRAPLPDSEGAWDTHLRRALWLAGIWGGFFLGAALSGAMTAQAGPWALLVPVGALAVLAVLG